MAGEDCITRHEVMIHDRGGRRRINQLNNVGQVEYGRTKDGISTAKVIIYGKNCDAQAGKIRGIRTRRHELVIFRGVNRPWEGPIVQVAWFANRVEVTAHDVAEYPRYTMLSKRWPNADEGGKPLMGDRIREIVNYELTTPYKMTTNQGERTVPRWEQLSPPINFLPYFEVRTGTIPTWSVTEEFEMTLLEHLQNLSRGGMDWTTIGRKMIFWDSAVPIARIRNLTENDFYGELNVYESGADYVSISHVSATQDETSGSGNVGHAGNADPYFGVWEELISLDSEEGEADASQLALNTQAQRNQTGRTGRVPVEIVVPANAGIRLSHDLSIDDLVPGAVCQVIATLNLRPVSQLQELTSMKVTETPAGETIQITLEPSGEAGAYLESA